MKFEEVSAGYYSNSEAKANRCGDYIRIHRERSLWVKLGLIKHISTLNILKKKTCTLIGKGPSIDRYKLNQENLIVCLNESGLIFPSDFIVYIDHKVAKRVAPNTSSKILAAPRAVTVFNQSTYTWDWDYLNINDKYCTAPIALEIINLLGYKKVELVGFDAYFGKRSEQVYSNRLSACCRKNDDYTRINKQIDEVKTRHNLELIEWNPSKN